MELFFYYFYDHMNEISLVDKLFDVNITSSYHLGILICPYGLSYAVLDTVRVRFIALKNIPFKEHLDGDPLLVKLESILSTDPYLSRNYKKLSLSYTSPKSTLVPSPMYDPQDKERFMKLFGHAAESEVLLENYLQQIDTYLLFSFPERLMNILSGMLDTPRFYHQAFPLLENAITNAKSKSGKFKVYLAIYPGFLDVVVIAEGQLRLHNTFAFKTPKDLVFFVLYLFDQLELSPETTPVEISGFVYEQDESYLLLSKYIRQLSFQELNRSYSYSFAFNDLIPHHYSNLINLFRCE